MDVLPDLLLWAINVETLQAAVKACCTTPGRAFPPSLCEIRGAAAELITRAAGLPSAAEAWGAVMDSFRRTRFVRPKLLDQPLVEEAIRCMGGLEMIRMSENNMADRAHFLKIFEQLRERVVREMFDKFDKKNLPYLSAHKRYNPGIKESIIF